MKELEATSGVGRETIRYYIREGLLPEPERPSRNVAWYDESCVERIALIKELQNKRFLPLHLIKAILDSDLPPTRAQAEVLAPLDGKLFSSEASADDGIRLSEVADRAGVPARELLELAEQDILHLETRDGDRWLDATAVRIAELWGRMRAAGFTVERGLTPDRMKLYADVTALLVREEVRLFADTSGAHVKGDEAARLAEQGVEIMNEMLALMRKDAIIRTLRDLNAPLAQRLEAAASDEP